MNEPRSTMAEQIAQVISAFHKQQTGLAPRSVTVVLSEETLVITLHEALSPAEIALAQTAEGASLCRTARRCAVLYRLNPGDCPLRRPGWRISGGARRAQDLPHYSIRLSGKGAAPAAAGSKAQVCGHIVGVNIAQGARAAGRRMRQ